MSRHDDLLNEGPREAPEPETAEQKSRKLGLKTAGGAVAGGGVAAAKLGAIGGLGKFFLWIAAWSAFRSSWYFGGWIGVAAIVAIVLVVIAVERREKR